MTYIPTLGRATIGQPPLAGGITRIRGVCDEYVIIKIARKLFLITLNEYSMNGKNSRNFFFFFFFIRNRDIDRFLLLDIARFERM